MWIDWFPTHESQLLSIASYCYLGVVVASHDPPQPFNDLNLSAIWTQVQSIDTGSIEIWSSLAGRIMCPRDLYQSSETVEHRVVLLGLEGHMSRCHWSMQTTWQKRACLLYAITNTSGAWRRTISAFKISWKWKLTDTCKAFPKDLNAI